MSRDALLTTKRDGLVINNMAMSLKLTVGMDSLAMIQ
jgi:hypothetical protein